MVFSSTDFLFLFLPAFLAAYVLAAPRSNLVLLGFSLVFYAAGEGAYLAVMLAAILMNWAVGRLMADDPARRRLWLALGVGANLGLLGYFKYLGFLAADVLGLDAPAAEGIHLPLGISFFTFQAISFLVDTARGDCPPERSLLRVGLYISMFPQLVAGPIVRFASVAGKLTDRQVSFRHLYYGLAFFATGLAAKVLIADSVAPVADAVFAAEPDRLRADAALAGILAYTLQIYFDFLGYSSMAVGLGFLIGFDFPRNFAHPYTARSVTEFWRRWHISLSTWFRDYVYIPLGGNRLGPARTYLNLWIVFLLCGLWHGAAWTFVLWGALHGAFLAIERAGLGARLARLPGWAAVAYTMAAVMAGWVLFRAESLAGAAGLYAALLRWDAAIPLAAVLTNEALVAAVAGVALSGPWLLRALAPWVETPRFAPWPERLRPGPALAGGVLYALLLAAAGAKVLAGAYSPFIYFRF